MARTPKVVEDRREQIINAAMRVFAQKGYIRATNKDVAREAGITAGLIYHYFENKEALLKAIIEGRSPLKLVRTMPAQALALPPDIFLRDFFRQILSVVEGEDFIALLRVFLPEVLHNPEITPVGAGVLQEALQFLRRYLTSAIERGELRQIDADLAAQMLISNIIGFVLRRQVLRDPSALRYTQEQIVEAVVSTVMAGFQSED